MSVQRRNLRVTNLWADRVEATDVNVSNKLKARTVEATAYIGIPVSAASLSVKVLDNVGALIDASAQLAGNYSIVGGWGATAGAAQFATALGAGADATGLQSTALGNYAAATATQTTALGYTADATFNQATALGSATTAYGTAATAVGYDAQANATDSVAMGNQSRANFAQATAVGTAAVVSNPTGTAVGFEATAATQGAACGYNCNASAFCAAVGADCTAGTGLNFSASAIGRSCTASGASSIAIGNGCSSTADSAVTIGTSITSAVAGSFNCTHRTGVAGNLAVFNGDELAASNIAITSVAVPSDGYVNGAAVLGFGVPITSTGLVYGTWLRIGNIVMFNGRVDSIAASSGGNAVLIRLTPPVASTFADGAHGTVNSASSTGVEIHGTAGSGSNELYLFVNISAATTGVAIHFNSIYRVT